VVAPFDLNVPGPIEAYDFRARFPEDRTGGGRSRILIDQYTRKVTFALGSRTAPVGQRPARADQDARTVLLPTSGNLSRFAKLEYPHRDSQAKDGCPRFRKISQTTILTNEYLERLIGPYGTIVASVPVKG